jgi:hypothetical protein
MLWCVCVYVEAGGGSGSGRLSVGVATMTKKSSSRDVGVKAFEAERTCNRGRARGEESHLLRKSPSVVEAEQR